MASAEAGFAFIADASQGQKRPDLILLDYNLPDMDGLSFIKKLDEYSDTAIPIVMLTGEGSAKVAVEAMKNGVDDYILKDTEGQYLRLLPGVVGHVLTAHAQREQNRLLRQETERLLHRNQALMQNSMDGIRVLDLQGNVVEANDPFCRMLGYTREEMAHLNVADWDAQWSAEELRERFKALVGKSSKFETVHRHKDGSLTDVEVSTSGMEIDGQYFLLASSRDITDRKRAEAALNNSEANLRAMLDNSPYLLWLKDVRGQYISANKIFADYLRFDNVRQIIGKTDMELWPAELAEKYRADDAEVMSTRQQKHFEERVLDGDKLLWVETYKTPVIDLHGKVLGTVGIASDITERKKAEAELRLENETGRKRADELAQQFGYLLQNSFNEIYLFDARSLKFILTSEGAEKNLGYTDEELNLLTPLDLKPLYTRESFEELLAPLRSGKQQSLLFETIHRRKDGTTYPVEVRFQLMETESPVFLAVVLDITDRLRAERQLREFSAHLQAVREEEKAHFAREVHDDLGGTLAALKMDAYWLAGKLEAKEEMEPLRACAKSMVGLIDAAVLATRRIITDLRPTLLDDLGLMAALKWQCAEFKNRAGIECKFVCVEDENIEEKLDNAQLINLFRIAQESLTNVARHSGASRVVVGLLHDGEEIVLSVSDNGCGLPEGHTIDSTSYGIRGMRERVVQLGGNIEFETPPGGGFSVAVKLPLTAGNKRLKGVKP